MINKICCYCNNRVPIKDKCECRKARDRALQREIRNVNIICNANCLIAVGFLYL